MNAVNTDVSNRKTHRQFITYEGGCTNSNQLSCDIINFERLVDQILSCGKDKKVIADTKSYRGCQKRYYGLVATELHKHGIFVSVLIFLAIHGYRTNETMRKFFFIELFFLSKKHWLADLSID